MRTLRHNLFGASPRRCERLSPLVLVEVLVSVMVLLVGSLLFLFTPLRSHAATDNTDCTLIVPPHPLTARGLATPYQLTATDPANGPCHESNPNQSAFVQGVIYDPTMGTFSVYNPLIIDEGTQPAVVPSEPSLPKGAIVGIWFGFNANNLLLQGAQRNTLAQANCVNGLGQSLFTQFAYCNATAFFAAVNRGVAAGTVHIPALQTAKDGKTCPTVRDFSVVDQDQSDNVQTRYLVTANGQTAQFSAANQAALQNATPIANPSDNRLLTDFVDPALGCQAWQAANLADNNSPVATLALDELQAAADQQAPIALVPLTDPMTMVDTNTSMAKTNLYRQGVNQAPAASDQQASGTTYCQNLVQTGIPRLELDKPLTMNAPSPDAAAANTLFAFLAQRFQASYTMLNCSQLLNMPNPVTTQTDANGVVISATFNGQGSDPPAPATSATANPSPSATVGGQGGDPPAPATSATANPSPSATADGQGGDLPARATSATANPSPSATADGQGGDPPAPATSATANPSPSATADGQGGDSPAPATSATANPSPSATADGQGGDSPAPATSATAIPSPLATADGQGGDLPARTTTVPNCNVNGQSINGCTGTMTINSQP